MMSHPLQWNRLPLLTLALALGCSETPPAPQGSKTFSSPDDSPASTASTTTPAPPQSPAAPAAPPAAATVDAANTSKFDLRGHRVGTVTIAEFQKVVPESEFSWLPEDGPGVKTALLRLPGTYADRPLLAVMYSFYDGVLEQISLDPKDPSDIARFREQLEAKYGPPETPRAGFAEWRDETATLTLEPANLNLTAQRIKAKREADEKARGK